MDGRTHKIPSSRAPVGAKNNPEWEIDGCTEQVQDNSIKGPMPVHHGQSKVDKLRQALQQKNRDGKVNFIRGFTLQG